MNTTNTHMYTRIFGTLIAAVFLVPFLLPTAAEASPVIRTGEKISLSEDQTVNGDFYIGGDTISLSGVVEGDVYAAGRTVVINGEIKEDAVIAAGVAQIHGAVGDDVRIIADEAVIAEHVAGDAIVLARSLSVLSTASIDGDLVFVGGDADIAGDISGSITGKAESVRVDTAVGGDLTIDTIGLTLGDRAHIEGDVILKHSEALTRAPNSVVVGEIRTAAAPHTTSDPISVIPLLMLLFTTLVYLLLFREQLGPFVLHVLDRPGLHVLVGLIAFFIVPIFSILLVSSILGIPLGITTFFLFMVLLLVSWSLGGIVTGTLLARLFTGKYSLSLLWSILGTVLFMLMIYIPVIGILAMIAITLIVFGAIAVLMYQRIR